MREGKKLIFEKGKKELKTLNFNARLDIDPTELNELLPESLQRKDIPIPDIPEVEIVRHYFNLSHDNYGVDFGIYPLGSCTMKYNPKINEKISRLSGFCQIHPLQEENQGCLELMNLLSRFLEEITGMDAFTLQPAAGAHGELTGLLIIKKYFEQENRIKNKILIPDSAHGTNPASAKLAGFSIIELQSTPEGEIPLDKLEFAMEEGDVAGLMLTNPNTLGLFDRNIETITKIVHDNGGLCYYDGANLNPILGKCRPGDMGFDIVHLNLHKTFSTPHGGGGPGAGPVGVKKKLLPFLPEPSIIARKGRFTRDKSSTMSIGRIRSFWGNFGILVRAFSYIRALGADGLKRVAEISVLNANYLRIKLKEKYHLPYDRWCMHEFVLSDKDVPNGITTEDIAKRILDYGIYGPTIYFPLIVSGALMIEPTETESKDSLDHFIFVMNKIHEECRENPEIVKTAPHDTPIGRLDAVLAARRPILHD
ncbi:MAG: aminomethyl-transferring glycine dehydrogenase subunit GcvPB [Promethearchaeota archaeon]